MFGQSAFVRKKRATVEHFKDVLKNRGYDAPRRLDTVNVESDLHNERIAVDDVELSGKDAMTLFCDLC